MSLLHLQRRLICPSSEDRRLVLALLGAYLRQSLRAPGVLFFDVAQDSDPMVWTLNAGFATQTAFEAWENLTGASDWGRATAHLSRVSDLRPALPEILPETAADTRALFLLNGAAFATTAEAQLVDDLRTAGDLTLSLVARFGRAYLGHCGFSRLAAPFPAWALAPLATRASVRRQGIAESLVRTGIAMARDRGIAAIFVLGDPDYYDRFGFSAEAGRGFNSPWQGPQFQLLNLTGQALTKGPVTHAPAFGGLPDEA